VIGPADEPLEPLTPIATARLFEPLHRLLVELLEGLAPADWQRPTVAGAWRVRDVAAHLLEVDLRRLSVGRDGHVLDPGRPIRGYADLVGFLNDLNAEWIGAARRFSPGVLLDLIKASGPAMARMVADLPPHGKAPFAVDWAGESASENWFDIARDYTERWHHQMQIRAAVGAPGLLGAEWLVPVLDVSVRAFPRAFSGVDAPAGATVVFSVPVAGAGSDSAWSVRRERDPAAGWRVWRGAPSAPATLVRLPPDAAWRLLFNALPLDEARRTADIRGDRSLAEPILTARAVIV
jgi:uncharacterized protein (TIGR03083 family)